MVAVTALKPSVPKQLPPANNDFAADTTMTWTIPRIVEITVGLEINACACAEVN